MAALDRLTILIPETRELDLFAGMLESEGATTLRCPLVQSLDPEDLTETDKWINRCIAGAFDDLILLTGEGLRRLLALSGPRRELLIAALGRLRTVTRGPKPARVLREIASKNRAIGLSAPTQRATVSKPTPWRTVSSQSISSIRGQAENTMCAASGSKQV